MGTHKHKHKFPKPHPKGKNSVINTLFLFLFDTPNLTTTELILQSFQTFFLIILFMLTIARNDFTTNKFSHDASFPKIISPEGSRISRESTAQNRVSMNDDQNANVNEQTANSKENSNFEAGGELEFDGDNDENGVR